MTDPAVNLADAIKQVRDDMLEIHSDAADALAAIQSADAATITPEGALALACMARDAASSAISALMGAAHVLDMLGELHEGDGQ